MRGKVSFLFILFSGFFVFSLQGNAKEIEREELFVVLKKAAKAQFSLREQEITFSEVHEILRPYFTEEAMLMFVSENFHQKDRKYFMFRVDFPFYQIPPFTYSERTKIIPAESSLYVYEYFPSSKDGAVTYENHYQGVRLVQEEGKWKAAKVYYNLEKDTLFSPDLSVIDKEGAGADPVKLPLATLTFSGLFIDSFVPMRYHPIMFYFCENGSR